MTCFDVGGVQGGGGPLAKGQSTIMYKVRKGDTLSDIAKRCGCSVANLMKANPGIADTNKIRTGEIIRLPNTPQARGVGYDSTNQKDMVNKGVSVFDFGRGPTRGELPNLKNL